MLEKDGEPTLAYLAFLNGPLAGTTYPVTRTEIALGRANDNDVVIADLTISRTHARLYMRDGLWAIEKISQKNPLRVNHKNVDQETLAHNSQVSLGAGVSFRFLLEEPQKVAQETRTEVVSGAQEKRTVQATPAELGIHSLEWLDTTTGEREEYALTGNVVNIGRDSSNDLVFLEDFVADFHCQFVRQNGQWKLIYPHPQTTETNANLLVNGQSISGHKSYQTALKHHDIVRIGNGLGAIITLKYRDGRTDRQEAIPLLQVVELAEGTIGLGRAPENAVLLNHPQVSAHHAQLLLDAGQQMHRLVDLHSTNHTYVNGQATTNQLLQYGDEIRIGPFKLIYNQTRIMVYDESGGIRIDALEVRQVRNQRTLLNNISLSIPQRSFVALVGSSGAGKSTLMEALSGLRKAVGGTIYYNGQDYYENIEAFKTQIGYVPQDEIIHRDLTVERVLSYTARLRLPKDFTPEQIEQRINEVLDDVEMSHRRKNLVRQLSGGQRKRVSIALELLAKPSLFFLDEPTSGLDPGLDRRMMVLLRKLADKGHTIVLVTHATSNINVCDYVCFLAPGGNLAYYGPPEGARSYFKQSDFAEIYGMLDPGDSSQELALEKAEEFRQSDDFQRYIDEPLSHRPQRSSQLLHLTQKQRQGRQRGKAWRQFRLLVLRYLELLKNDRVNLAILLLQAPVIGLLLLGFIHGAGTDAFNPATVLECPATAAILAPGGYPDPVTPLNPVISTSCQRIKTFLSNDPAGQAYARQRGGVEKALQDFLVAGPGDSSTILFIMAFAAIMFGCVNSIREFVKEAPIYQRERAVNLGILPYMFSKMIVLGLLCMVQCVIMVICIAILDPYHQSILLAPFLEMYITVVLTSWAGLMIGLAVSALVSNNDRAVSFVPLILLPQVLFSGATFPLTSVVLQYPGMLFPVRWAMVALGSSVGLHSDKINGDELLPGVYSYHGTLFSTYSSQDAFQYLLLSWLALVAMLLVLGIGIGLILKRKDTRR